MNYKMILNTVGKILCLEAALMVPAFFISLGNEEIDSMRGLAMTIVLTAAVGVLLLTLIVPKNKNFYAREGFFTVAFTWVVISLFGALPFFFSGAIPSFVDCWFETVSGFTTTGASIIPDVLAIPKGLLYWRSFTHWLGGMGVLVFVLALQPMARGGSGQAVHLLRAESPGPEVEKLTPRMHQTAKILYSIYIGMTLLQILLLALGGMPLFDNICITFGSAGTGGFAVLPDSIASYSPYIQWVVTIFMALFGVNFSIYYLFLLKKPKQALKSEELRWYVGILLGATALIAVNTWGMHGGAAETIRHSAFQVSSIMTTTGYAHRGFQPLAGVLALGADDPYDRRRVRGVHGRRHQGLAVCADDKVPACGREKAAQPARRCACENGRQNRFGPYAARLEPVYDGVCVHPGVLLPACRLERAGD